MELNWIGLVLVVLGLYLAFKLIGAAFRLLMWLVVLAGAYWFVAPALGWPTLSDLVYAFGPDFDGRRIEEVFTPARVADGLGERMVDGVVERMQGVELPGLPEPVEVPEEAPVEEGEERGEADGSASGSRPALVPDEP